MTDRDIGSWQWAVVSPEDQDARWAARGLISAWCSSLEASLRWLCTEETVTLTKREYEELTSQANRRMVEPLDNPPPLSAWLPHPAYRPWYY